MALLYLQAQECRLKTYLTTLEAGDSIEDFLNDFDYIPRKYAVAVLAFSEKLLTEQKLYENFA